MADQRLSDFSERMSLRRRRSRGRRVRSLLVTLTLLVAVSFLAWLVRFSSVFDVTAVDVRGATLVSAAQVRTRAGVATGVPLATVDTGAVARRVASLTQVSSAEVSRRWPHTVVITLTERTPVYQRIVGHRYQWVDAQGVIFHETSTRTASLPEVTTTGVDNLVLADVATVVSALPADAAAPGDTHRRGGPRRHRSEAHEGPPDRVGERRFVGSQGPGRARATAREGQRLRRVVTGEPDHQMSVVPACSAAASRAG